ncbi:hypothetical protein BFW41_14995 [Aeromonas hydrophila]|nr:hypothetical protein BFW41_14995 [Aeromonas hydrophila]
MRTGRCFAGSTCFQMRLVHQALLGVVQGYRSLFTTYFYSLMWGSLVNINNLLLQLLRRYLRKDVEERLTKLYKYHLRTLHC